MFENAFNFAIDYFSNPDKVVKDRTGTKQRGLGQILDDQMIGKIVEYGVCKIIELNYNNKKKIIPDNQVKSDFEYGQPDVVQVIEGREKRLPKIFLEIKNSPKNYEWISVYDSQFDGMKKWEKQNTNKSSKSDNIFVIFASLLDKHGERVFADATEEGNDEKWLMPEELTRIEITKKEMIKEISKEIKCTKKIAEKIMNLSESQKDDIEKLSEETLRGIKNLINLKTTFKKRKSDVLGSFLKFKKLSPKFDFFFNLNDFKVRIDYILLGNELHTSGIGQKFFKNEIWPSPEIFWDNTNKKPSSIKIRSEAKGKEGSLLSSISELGEKKKLNLDILVNNTTYWKNPHFWHYPKQFGNLSFSEKTKIFVKETTSRAKLENNQTREKLKLIILESKNKITVSSDFLGTFSLEPGSWKINLWTKLEDLKNRNDYAIPKRYYDQFLTGTTSDRIQTISQNI